MRLTRLGAAVTGLMATVVMAGAQVPPPVLPGQPPPQGRGGGRGRGAVRVFTLQSSSFTDGAEIPTRHAQPGHDASPPLTWTGAPDSTVSFVLIVHDANAAIGTGTDDLLHWMVWNIPGSATSIPEGVPQGAQLADGSRQISATGPNYRGPAAPPTGPPHHYLFELYALDVMLDVAPVGASPPATRAAVVAAMAGHVRGKAVAAGLFRRAGASAVAPPADTGAAAQRAVLLNPAHAFWTQRAPETFRAWFEVTQGEFVVEVHRAWAPRGADRFFNLVRAGYFDDSRFFRVVEGRFAQFGIAGDPALNAVWKDRAFPDDSVVQHNVRGAVAFAMTGPDTRTTQLFVSLVDNHRQFDAEGFAPIGRVVDGMDVVDVLYAGYGENAGGGMRAGKQARMMAEGNAHLDRDYPKLDRVIRVTLR